MLTYIPAIVATLIAFALAWKAWTYRLEQKNITEGLSREAAKLIDTMQSTSVDLAASTEISDFTSMGAPKYLATLCTVLVQKAGGTVRLTEQDFHELPDAEYISVYVDTTDSSILLCLNSADLPVSPSTGEDETTYN
jgi:hypothetical protein